MTKLVFSSMVPATRKTTIRGPSASTAKRNDPGPESLKFVTSITFPPRPPTVRTPNPSAPGKEAGFWPAWDDGAKVTGGTLLASDGTGTTKPACEGGTQPGWPPAINK